MIVNGRVTRIVVDDWIPTIYGKPAFAGSVSGDNPWICLLEKAYAKVNGSYDAIESGTACQMMHDISGAPTENL